MTLTHERVARCCRPRRVILGLAGGFLLLAGELPVSAAPISSVRVRTQQSSHPLTAFEAFLNGGPAHWAKSQLMEIPAGVKLTKHHGQLKNNMVVDYVMWVRDQHPAVFDRRHPVLGPMLATAQEERGTQFLVFSSKHQHSSSTQAEAIHAMGSSGSTSTSSTSSSSTSAPASASVAQSQPTVQAQSLLAPSVVQVFPKPRAAIIQSPQVAAETLVPPSVGALPTPGGSIPTFSQQILTSSVVSTNFPLAQESLEGSPAPVPEPSSLGLTLVLFASAACWKGWRARG